MKADRNSWEAGFRVAGMAFLYTAIIGAAAGVVRDTYNGELRWMFMGMGMMAVAWALSLVRKHRAAKQEPTQ